jgi:DNA mismatch endonuclease (patch repair protein)
MDVHDKKTRSFNMSRIRSRDTKPEIALRKALWSRGHRGYRTRSKLPGRPDVVFGRLKLAVFVDGCFWHGCPKCGDGRPPRSNLKYWSPKLATNRERDRRQTLQLRRQGWTVLRMWEHDVLSDTEKCAERVSIAVQRLQRVVE